MRNNVRDGLIGHFSLDSFVSTAREEMYQTSKCCLHTLAKVRACKDNDPILTRCSTLVSTFAVSKIDHVKGSEHILADEISRSRAIEADLPVGTMSNKEAEPFLNEEAFQQGEFQAAYL